jgi:hypothetical protein
VSALSSDFRLAFRTLAKSPGVRIALGARSRSLLAMIAGQE